MTFGTEIVLRLRKAQAHTGSSRRLTQKTQEDSMLGFTKIVTFAATVAAVVPLQAQEAEQDASMPKQAGEAAIAVLPPSVSPEILSRISDLWVYDDRFEKAIRMIEAEALRPTWSGATTCEPPALGSDEAFQS